MSLPKDHLDEFPWKMGWLWHHLHNYGDCKTKETQMHKIHKQKGWVVWCPHSLHQVFQIWPFLTLNWKRLSCLVGKQPGQNEGLGYT